MKKEYYRESLQCKGCAFHCFDEESGKESCKSAGYYIWDDLETAERCFDALSPAQWDRIQSTPQSMDKRANEWFKILCSNNDAWRKTHKCASCAFFMKNGFDACDKETQQTWAVSIRCRGYFHDAEKEVVGECNDYLTVDQWARIQAELETTGMRMKLWNQFKLENQSKAVKETITLMCQE